jgi:hypothetical protein
MSDSLLERSRASRGFDLERTSPAVGKAKQALHALRSMTWSFERQRVCPRCHWKCVRRAKRRKPLDLFLALLFMRPFRCRSCRRRYYSLSF